MRKRVIAFMLLLSLLLPASQTSAQIPIISLITGAAKKVIRAIDLRIQREQNKVIWLQNAQKALENAMSKLKLKEISDWSEKQRKLYGDYFEELRKVKNLISTYKLVKDIMARQIQLVSEYKHAWNLLSQDKHFTTAEISEMYRVYSGILDESLRNLDELLLVTNSFTTQMSDGKRLELINDASVNMDKNLGDIRVFNKRNFRISVARSNGLQEAETLKKIYGL